jgi:hypothetical protein
MKITAVVKSEALFSLLNRKLGTIQRLPDYELLACSSMLELEDSLEFSKPDLYIVHKDMEGSESYLTVLRERGNRHFVFEDNLNELESYLIEHFGVEEVIEDELQSELEESMGKERIIYQEKIVEKRTIEKQYETIPFKIIIVGSMNRSAGSTILATNLARMVGERGLSVSYVEHPLIKPYMFDYLQIHSDTDDYFDLSRNVKSEKMGSLKAEPYKRFGVNWHVINSMEPSLKEFEYHHLLMLTHATDSNIVILDISDRWRDPEVQKLMRLASLVLVAVEPDPIKFEYASLNYEEHGVETPTPEYTAMKHLKEQIGNNYELVLMKEVKLKDINRVLKEQYANFKRPIATLPYIEYPVVLEALQNQKLLYDINISTKNQFETNLLSIISRFLPKDLVELPSKPKGFLGRIMK